MHRRFLRHRFTLAAAAFLLAVAGPAAGDDIDHNEVLRLLQDGRILALSEITAAVRAEVPGEVLEVELEREDGLYVYELKVLGPNGRVREVEIDAATGKIIDIEDDD